MSVENNATLCYTKSNTTQLSLWDTQSLPEPETHILPFRWANGDTSDAAALRMLSHVQGKTNYLYSWEYIDGHLVGWRANVLEAWIEQGVVYGRCIMTPSGAYVKAMRAGRSLDKSEDDEL